MDINSGPLQLLDLPIPQGNPRFDGPPGPPPTPPKKNSNFQTIRRLHPDHFHTTDQIGLPVILAEFLVFDFGLDAASAISYDCPTCVSPVRRLKKKSRKLKICRNVSFFNRYVGMPTRKQSIDQDSRFWQGTPIKLSFSTATRQGEQLNISIDV